MATGCTPGVDPNGCLSSWHGKAFSEVGQMYIAYWHTEVTALDRELMNSEVGDPSFQNEWELLTIWMSLEAFAPWLREQSITPQVLIRTGQHCGTQSSS